MGDQFKYLRELVLQTVGPEPLVCSVPAFRQILGPFSFGLMHKARNVVLLTPPPSRPPNGLMVRHMEAHKHTCTSPAWAVISCHMGISEWP